MEIKYYLIVIGLLIVTGLITGYVVFKLSVNGIIHDDEEGDINGKERK